MKKITRLVGVINKKRKIYIFSEGRNTEPLYFEAYAHHVGDVAVEVICIAAAGVPLTIARHAQEKIKYISTKKYKKEFGDSDVVWVVFDRDEHPNISEALQMCAQNNIYVGYSNPCFELWLILHFKDFDAGDDRFGIQKKCESICPGYKSSSHKVPELSTLLPKVEDAERRAEAMEARRREDGAESPRTSVYLLTRHIRNIDPL
ncbi:RloB family protein [Pararhodospirillum photometricum]|uniref:RloB family protein n=1 Tax=Pararhodospirillum photometricum TaxID=1084 RepID=UPI0009D99586|nr:RloB family protein [Pararhodospirillum photometricum]